jgi:hypothetical protein
MHGLRYVRFHGFVPPRTLAVLIASSVFVFLPLRRIRAAAATGRAARLCDVEHLSLPEVVGDAAVLVDLRAGGVTVS